MVTPGCDCNISKTDCRFPHCIQNLVDHDDTLPNDHVEADVSDSEQWTYTIKNIDFARPATADVAHPEAFVNGLSVFTLEFGMALPELCEISSPSVGKKWISRVVDKEGQHPDANMLPQKRGIEWVSREMGISPGETGTFSFCTARRRMFFSSEEGTMVNATDFHLAFAGTKYVPGGLATMPSSNFFGPIVVPGSRI